MLSCVIDAALAISGTCDHVYVCTYREMSLSEARVHVGCPEMRPQEFFMLVTNIFLGL